MQNYAESGLIDGQDGFDTRLMRDLNDVGVHAYKVGHLARSGQTFPPAIPVYIDWLNDLDARVPGEETRHRSTLRRSLIWALDDPAAKGNRAASDAVLRQLARTSPALEPFMQIQSAAILARIASKDEFDRIVDLSRRPSLEDGARVALVKYFGRYRRPESRDFARAWLTRPIVRQEAVRTLGKIGTAEDIDAIASYVDDEDPQVRRAVESALKKLRS
ncbi:hypothetical protein GCM10009551_044970 [Nocardiopsis tropica]